MVDTAMTDASMPTIVANSQAMPVTGTIGNFQLTKKLGSGFSAKVKLAHTADGHEYALKIFDLTRQSNDKNFIGMLKEEIKATMGLKHKHIIRYHEF